MSVRSERAARAKAKDTGARFNWVATVETTRTNGSGRMKVTVEQDDNSQASTKGVLGDMLGMLAKQHARM